MLALVLSLMLFPVQREPVPMRRPLPEVLQVLRRARNGSADVASELARLPELLDSPVEELVEGAAFAVGEHQRVECVPALLEVLRRDRLGRYGKSSRVDELALDALIRLGISAPDEELFHDRLRARPELIFAALMLEPDRVRRCNALAKLLERTKDGDTAHWAAAIELVRERDRRVAEALLRQEWRASLTVVGAHGASKFSGRWGCASTRCGRSDVWPPYVGYSIGLGDVDQALASPVVVRKTRSRCFNASFIGVSDYVRDTWRLRLLAELAPRVRVLSTSDLSSTTENTDAHWLRSLVEMHRDRITAQVESLAVGLEAQGLLRSSADVRRQLRIVVELVDSRADRNQELVAPAPVEGVRLVVKR